MNNNNPWPECGKDGAHQQGLCVHPSVQPLQNTRSRPSQNEPWHDCWTQHYNSWPCLQSNVLFHNLNTPLHSGSPLPKSKAWKNNPCPWPYMRTRKQMSLCTMEVDSAIECHPKKGAIGNHTVGQRNAHTTPYKSVRQTHKHLVTLSLSNITNDTQEPSYRNETLGLPY